MVVLRLAAATTLLAGLCATPTLAISFDFAVAETALEHATCDISSFHAALRAPADAGDRLLGFKAENLVRDGS